MTAASTLKETTQFKFRSQTNFSEMSLAFSGIFENPKLCSGALCIVIVYVVNDNVCVDNVAMLSEFTVGV